MVNQFKDVVTRLTSLVRNNKGIHLELEIVGKMEVDADYEVEQEGEWSMAISGDVAQIPVASLPASANIDLERNVVTVHKGEGPFKNVLFMKAKLRSK